MRLSQSCASDEDCAFSRRTAGIDRHLRLLRTGAKRLGPPLPLDEIEYARQLIAQLPHAWHPLNSTLRRCVLRHFPYGLIYRIHNNCVEVIAVAHHHRQPEYWRERRNK